MTSRSKPKGLRPPPPPRKGEGTPDPVPTSDPIPAVETEPQGSLKDALEALDASLPNIQPDFGPEMAAPPVKRGPGRPKGSKTRGASKRTTGTKAELVAQVESLEMRLEAYEDQPADPEEIQTQCRFAAAVTMRTVFAGLAQYLGPWWKLEDAEVDTLADAWGPVLALHHQTLGTYLPYMAAVGATVQVVIPRYRLSSADPVTAETPEAAPVQDDA